MIEALESRGANPGRGSYAFARRTEEMVEAARRSLARLINAPDPSRLAFTAGATMSLNAAVLGFSYEASPGKAAEPGQVITTSMEHNALLRPLTWLEDAGRLEVVKIQADPWGYITAGQVEAAISPRTRLIALSMASNVCGAVQPVAEIGALARRRGLPLLVDASQTAGLLDIDVQAMGISLLALAGHKYLLGPAGVGALWAAPEIKLRPLLHGGTGADAEQRSMPDYWPARLEAGSLNIAGIAGLAAGLDFIQSQGRRSLYQQAMALTQQLESSLRPVRGLHLQVREGETRPRAPLLSFTLDRLTANQAAAWLDQKDICLRAGYHCAPDAHQTLGSLDEGSLRLSPGWATTPREIQLAAQAIAELSRL